MKPLRLALLLAFLGAGASPQEDPLPARIDAAVAGISGFRQTPVSGRCADGEFLRRVMLDLVGYPPNAGEARAFSADPAAEKRAAKVDQLLAGGRYADYWARRWMGVFFGNYHELRLEPLKGLEPEEAKRIMESFRQWMERNILLDRPWTDTVRDLLSAQGKTDKTPALAYKLALHQWPRAPYFEGRAARHFLGVDLMCSGCHDHPFDRWTVEDGLAMSAFSNGRQLRLGKGGLEVMEGAEPPNRPIPGDKGFIPGWPNCKGTVVPPRFLFGGAPKDGEVLAEAFARLMVAPENLQFRKAAVNRVWSWLLGRGIVSPVDAFDQKNKPLSGPLITLLAKEFSENGHSVKFLIRAICASETYQRGCDGTLPLPRANFSRMLVRPLSAEQILNSIDVATLGKPGFDLEAARKLADKMVRGDAPACETTEEFPDARALLWIANGERVWRLIREGPVVKSIRTGKGDPEGMAKAMFLAALSRAPSPSELERYSDFLRGRGMEIVDEAYWTLLNSAEFLTRH
jgi:hypothetical protein